jgi:hypothetical protein
VQPHDLFVFAGAGASYCRPAALPMFLAIRDEILHQLELDRYIPTWDPDADAGTAKYRQVAAGLNPEPFMLALKQADLEVGPWLAGTLRAGSANAVHHALAELAGAGAAVWTVNFDTKIEDAAKGTLRVSAFPATPAPDAQLLKPHGTLDGELILDSEQVLRPLRSDWENRLHADVQGRTVVLLGAGPEGRTPAPGDPPQPRCRRTSDVPAAGGAEQRRQAEPVSGLHALVPGPRPGRRGRGPGRGTRHTGDRTGGLPHAGRGSRPRPARGPARRR